MMDQHRPIFPKNQETYRSSRKSNLTTKNDTERKNCAAGRVDIIAMVRSLQRRAGMTDCFRQGNVDCDIIDCDWRSYCLGTPVDPKRSGKPTPLK
jgi:hypothetical protein